MISFLSSFYLEIKTFHLFSLIAWMVGLFYFPRLLVYHVQNKQTPEVIKVFKVMESRLYKIIMKPAMIFSLISGGILATIKNDWLSKWMHLKLSAVIGLVFFHHLLHHWHKGLLKETCLHSEKFFRVINEIPTLLLTIILFSVIFKPF